MPPGGSRSEYDGLKRSHSPEPHAIWKVTRRATDSSFRVCGAHDGFGRSQDNGSPLKRRHHYPERRKSLDERIPRDTPFEHRHQPNYMRDGPLRGTGNGRAAADLWTPYRDDLRPFNARERERERSSRFGSNASNRNGPSQDLDLRKGGQSSYRRYN